MLLLRGLAEDYGGGMQQIIRMLYAVEDTRHTVTVETLKEDPQRPYRARIVIVNRALMKADGSGPVRNVDFDARDMGGGPAALLTALILATPVSWPRRGWGLLWGIPCVYIICFSFFGFCIWDESSRISLVAFTPPVGEFVKFVRDLVSAQLGLTVPVVLWIVVLFRREDFRGRFALNNRKVKT